VPESQRKYSLLDWISEFFFWCFFLVSFSRGMLSRESMAAIRGGCDFYRWEGAYAAHVATFGGAAHPVGQIGAGQMQGGQAAGAQVVQAPQVHPVQQNGAPEASQAASFASTVAGYMLAAAPVAGRQGAIVADAHP
jgi:hypothetical protein